MVPFLRVCTGQTRWGRHHVGVDWLLPKLSGEKNHTQGLSLSGRPEFHWPSQESLVERGHLPWVLKDEWDFIR